jgi:hypothetical protein
MRSWQATKVNILFSLKIARNKDKLLDSRIEMSTESIITSESSISEFFRFIKMIIRKPIKKNDIKKMRS